MDSLSCMPEFNHSLVLLLIPLVPFVVWLWHRRPGRALLYSDLRLFSQVPSGRASLVRRLEVFLRGLVLVLVLVAGAGPRWPDKGSRVMTEGIAIEMIVDNSGSMAEPDFLWKTQPISRLEAVKKVFHYFVEGTEGP